MAINPTFLALSAANPGLLPLAFIGSGGSYEKGWLDNWPFPLVSLVIFVYSIFVVLVLMAALATLIIGSIMLFHVLPTWLAILAMIIGSALYWGLMTVLISTGYRF